MTGVASLFLHMGVHKTGTTAIQRFLDNNQVPLARSGVHWLQTGKSEAPKAAWGHEALAIALRDGDLNNLWLGAAREVRAHSVSLVSSETFCLLVREGFYERIFSAMQDVVVNPICFLRRQDQLLESIYNHHVKALGETRPIMDFAKLVMHRLDYARLVSRLSCVFGPQSLRIRVYDRTLMNADIFSEFLSTIGLTDLTPFARADNVDNLGLSRDGLGLMLEANKKYANDPETLNSLRHTIIRDYQAQPWTSHEALEADQRAELMDKYRDGNSYIAGQFFGRAELFF